MKKFDIGIFGWWYNMNYGANLTYFSLNRVLKKMGYSVGMIWKAVNPDALPDTTATRFADKYYEVGPAFSKKDMKKHNDFYNTFLLGSDQLWSPKQENITGKDFFFSFVDPGKGKVAYAQSVGRDVGLPKDFIGRYIEYVDKFDAVSVREDYAVDLLKNGFGVTAQHVCDPIFLSDISIWNELIDNAKIQLPESDYVLNLILDPDKDKMDFCEKVRERIGISDYINFTAMTPRVPWEKGFGKEPFGNEEGAVERLVKAYSEAKFIITDSFHGTCLAIIFKKPFISIANYKRGVERFESLLRWLKINDRIIYDVNSDSIQDGMHQLDYSQIDKIIEKSKNEGLKWLKDKLKGTFSVPRQLGHMKCVGCGACVCVCPTGALELKADEYGYYRAFVDRAKCTDCKKCDKVCPALNPPEKNNYAVPEVYVFQGADESALKKCSSGGAFALLSEKIFEHGGYVSGVAWGDDFKCKHIIVKEKNELQKINKSKYFQSFMGDTIKQIDNILQKEKPVLFSGCPCQVAGVKNYFKGKDENLYLVDILCNHAPSSLFFEKYIKDVFGEALEEYTFRDKTNGWDSGTVKYKLKDKDPVVIASKDNVYLKNFRSHTMTPYHCENCKYQKLPRHGDISIGDFWKIKKHLPDLDVTNGVSVILCNNEKGKSLFDSIEQDRYITKKAVPVEWLGNNGFAYKGKNYKSEYRDTFYKNIKNKGFLGAVEEVEREIEDKEYFNMDAWVLNCDFTMPDFEYEKDFWEGSVNKDEVGEITLKAHLEESPRGHFATIRLKETLKKGERYQIYIRCKIYTDSKSVNFHIAESKNPKNLQVVISHKVKREESEKWINIRGSFICKKNNMDSLSIGAFHISGQKRKITFNYIGIIKEK